MKRGRKRKEKEKEEDVPREKNGGDGDWRRMERRKNQGRKAKRRESFLQVLV